MKIIHFSLVCIATTLGSLSSKADEMASLMGNTLICTSTTQPNSVWMLYVTRERSFAYHSYKGKRSQFGQIYEFGKQYKGKSGKNSYQSAGELYSNGLILKMTVVNRTCGICDGKTIMQADEIRVEAKTGQWHATRNYRQWFPDGTPVAVPSGRETYRCEVAQGRTGIGQ